jgi:EmrB/QacA subfamily drug resistance transporter
MKPQDHKANKPNPVFKGIDRRWWVLAVVGMGSYMSALDSSIVNIALPVISHQTKAAVSIVEWVVLAYLVTLSSSLLLFGRLGDIYGKRRIFTLGIGLFGVGSGLCGISGDVGFLIAFRIVQGIGAAMIISLSPAIVTSAFPANERGKALGLQATMTYLGLTTGPVLGGCITEHLGWPFIFFINIPIVLLMAIAAFRVMQKDSERSTQALDPVGSTTLAVAVATLLLALTIGSENGWHSISVVSLALLSLAAFVTFIITERSVKNPVLNLKLFANRTFAASVMAAYLNYVAIAAVNFLLPFFLIQACGYSESKAGMLMMTAPIAMVLLTGPSGHASDKIGVKLPATIGMILTVLGMIMLRGLGPSATPFQIVPFLAILGIGAGLFTSPNNSAIMGAAPPDMKGVAGAMLSTARTVGFASGVALAGAIYVSQLHSLTNIPHPEAISKAMHMSLLVVAILASAGILFSAMRGNTSSGKLIVES